MSTFRELARRLDQTTNPVARQHILKEILRLAKSMADEAGVVLENVNPYYEMSHRCATPPAEADHHILG
jgi:hypothetical protein